MKRLAATAIAFAALAAPAPVLAAPWLGAPLPGARAAQAGTTTTGSTGTGTTTTGTGTTTTPVKPVKLTINNFADRRALNAYAAYLTTLIDQESIGQTYDSAYITTISQPGTGGCKAALSKLTQPPYQIDTRAQHTLTVLGEEVGDDVTVTYDLAATVPFAKFTAVLQALHWTRLSGAYLVIKHYIDSQDEMLALAPSNLCLDASDAQLRPDVVPNGTKTFIPLYDEATNRANLGLTNLLTLLQTYEIPSEKALVTHISMLADQLSTETKADLLQSGTTLTTVLESS